MKTVSLLLIVGLFSPGLAQIGLAQETLDLDLSISRFADTVRVLPGKYQVRLRNALTKFSYTIEVQQIAMPTPPIVLTSIQGKGDENECPVLKKAVDAFDRLAKENEVPAAVSELQRAIAGADPKVPDCSVLLPTAQRQIASTVFVNTHIWKADRGNYIVVTATRGDQVWKRVYSTGPIGEWDVSWGYLATLTNGVSDSGPFADAHRYFLRELPRVGAESTDPTLYRVERQKPRQSIDLTPVVVMSWSPTSPAWHGIQWSGVAGGLATDLSAPLAFLGSGVSYQRNVILNVGIAGAREKDLSTQYSVGDTVKTNLTSEQLYESVFRLRPTFSLSIRLSGNPFKKDEPKPATEEKPADKPVTADKAADNKKTEGK